MTPTRDRAAALRRAAAYLDPTIYEKHPVLMREDAKLAARELSDLSDRLEAFDRIARDSKLEAPR